MLKMMLLNCFVCLNKYLKNVFWGVGIGLCIYVIVESVMYGMINGVEVVGVLMISVVFGLFSVFLDIKVKLCVFLILLYFFFCGGCVVLMVVMLLVLNYFLVNVFVIFIISVLFIVIYLLLGFIFYCL